MTSSHERLQGFTWHKCSLWDPDQVLLPLCGFEIQYGNPGLSLVDIFDFFLKNGCRDLLQTWYKCSLMGPNQVLLL